MADFLVGSTPRHEASENKSVNNVSKGNFLFDDSDHFDKSLDMVTVLFCARNDLK